MRSDVRHGTDLNPTAAALLGLLLEQPMTGWDLVGEAEHRVGNFWTITRSQVYRELAGMETAGLVVAGAVGSRDRKPYSVTDRGRTLFGEWVAADPGGEQVRIPLLLTLSFARHLPPAHVRDLLVRQRAEHAARLAGYEEHRRRLATDHGPHPDDDHGHGHGPVDPGPDGQTGPGPGPDGGGGGGGASDAPGAIPDGRAATLGFGLHHERAVVAWLDELLEGTGGHAAD